MNKFKEYGFYDYQIEAANQTEKNNKGIVVMPTATGKTFVQAGIIANDISKNSGFRMYVVNAPRIMLSYQLLDEVFKFNVRNNIDARYLAVHSGKIEQKELDKYRDENSSFNYSKIDSTTSPLVVTETINKAKEANQPLIIFSTYNSSIRIEEGRGDEIINIILNDEAHYLIRERFNTDFNKMETERKYFFTATTKETPSDEGLGMNNVGFYGEKIFIMTPAEAIQKGKMVRPRVHIVSTDDDRVLSNEELEKNLGRLVMNSFTEHSKLLKHGLKGKMLIAASGTNDMKRLIGDDLILDFINRGGKFYAISTDKEVLAYVNGKKITRREWLKQLQIDGSNYNQEMIVIHYDILTEGIDVPGLTGVLFLRNQSKSKFIQTFGRVARLDRNDKILINKNIITPNETDKMNKPYAWIIIPAVKTEDGDKLANLRDLIDQLRDHDFNPAEGIEPNDRGNGDSETDDDSIVPEDNIRRLVADVIENYEHVIEDERIANRTWEEVVQNEINNGLNNDTMFEF